MSPLGAAIPVDTGAAGAGGFAGVAALAGSADLAGAAGFDVSVLAQPASDSDSAS